MSFWLGPTAKWFLIEPSRHPQPGSIQEQLGVCVLCGRCPEGAEWPSWPVLWGSLLTALGPPQASCILQLVKHVQKLQAKDVPVAEEVSSLFAGELNPVAPKAQKKVPIPEG